MTLSLSNNIRLILSLSNNYHDFGGRPQYASWARSAGAQISGDDDFYTNQLIKGYYNNHVKTVLTRINTITKVAYKDDAIIMAWELILEHEGMESYYDVYEIVLSQDVLARNALTQQSAKMTALEHAI
ncbi:hypothetical protein ACFE04_005297 [Oxalis oulophora]